MEEERTNKNWQQFEKTGCIADYLLYRGFSSEEMRNSEGCKHEGDNSSHGNCTFGNADWGI